MQEVDAVKELELATALPARYHFGDHMLAMEQRAVFARSWLRTMRRWPIPATLCSKVSEECRSSWSAARRGESGGAYGEGQAFYYHVYPNVMLNLMPGRLQPNRIVPLGPRRCRVEFDYYCAQDEQAMARIAADQSFSDEVQVEDISICETVQTGLASGFYDAGRLCPKRESGVGHFQNLLRTAYA
ncbi:MAG: SRPBCC family protein, partial [Pseudoxanthomonas sp.]